MEAPPDGEEASGAALLVSVGFLLWVGLKPATSQMRLAAGPGRHAHRRPPHPAPPAEGGMFGRPWLRSESRPRRPSGKLNPVADHLGKRCRIDELGLDRSAYPIMVLLASSVELGRSNILGMRYDGGEAIRRARAIYLNSARAIPAEGPLSGARRRLRSSRGCRQNSRAALCPRGDRRSPPIPRRLCRLIGLAAEHHRRRRLVMPREDCVRADQHELGMTSQVTRGRNM